MSKFICFTLFFLIFSGISSAQDYYWVGGTGEWSDYANHWATSSGGNIFHTQVPQSADNVIFDENSFTGEGQIVTLDIQSAYCKDMTWTGAGNNPVLGGSLDRTLKIYGSLTFIEELDLAYTGTFTFESTVTGNTITLSGQALTSPILFDSPTGGWILQDSFVTTKGISLINGDLNTNDQYVESKSLLSTVSVFGHLQLGSTTLRLVGTSGYTWSVNELLDLDAESSRIILEEGSFYDVGNTYNEVEFNLSDWGVTMRIKPSEFGYMKKVTVRQEGISDSLWRCTGAFKIDSLFCYSDNSTINGQIESEYIYSSGRFRINNVNDSKIAIIEADGEILFEGDQNRGNEIGKILANAKFSFMGNSSNNTIDSCITIGTSIVAGSANYFGYLQTFGPVTLGNANSFGYCDFREWVDIQGQGNTFDECYFGKNAAIAHNSHFKAVTMSPGYSYLLPAGGTIYIDSTLEADGSPDQVIEIRSSATGSSTFIKLDSAVVCGEFIYLRDITAAGINAEFYAGFGGDDIDNNSGWIFEPGTNCVYNEGEYYLNTDFITDKTSGVAPLTVSFTDLTSGTPDIWYWDFGDNSYSNDQNPSHTFLETGNYTACLTVLDSTNDLESIHCTDISVGESTCHAEFTYDIDTLTGTVEFYNSSLGVSNNYWEFGDGTSSSEAEPSHDYIAGGFFTVSLTASNPGTGCFDTYSEVIYINEFWEDCNSDFYFVADTLTNLVKFYNRSSGYNMDGLLWNFGDGVTSTDMNPEHEYLSSGFYEVCLTSYFESCSNIFCQTISAGDNEGDCKAIFNYEVEPGTYTVHFYDMSMGEPNDWNWNFGDGGQSIEQDPVYMYDESGIYHVHLNIKNLGNKCVDHVNDVIDIQSGNDNIQATFSFVVDSSSQNKKSGMLVEFKGASFGVPSAVEWDFGDGTYESSTVFPEHIYAVPGDYRVCYTIEDPIIGQKNTYCRNLSTGVGTIDRELDNTISIYPNPAEDKIMIEYNTPGEIYRAELVSNLGQVLFEKHIHSTTGSAELDISSLESGYYLLKIITDKGTIVKQLIKGF